MLAWAGIHSMYMRASKLQFGLVCGIVHGQKMGDDDHRTVAMHVCARAPILQHLCVPRENECVGQCND